MNNCVPWVVCAPGASRHRFEPLPLRSVVVVGVGVGVGCGTAVGVGGTGVGVGCVFVPGVGVTTGVEDVDEPDEPDELLEEVGVDCGEVFDEVEVD